LFSDDQNSVYKLDQVNLEARPIYTTNCRVLCFNLDEKDYLLMGKFNGEIDGGEYKKGEFVKDRSMDFGETLQKVRVII